MNSNYEYKHKRRRRKKKNHAIAAMMQKKKELLRQRAWEFIDRIYESLGISDYYGLVELGAQSYPRILRNALVHHFSSEEIRRNEAFSRKNKEWNLNQASFPEYLEDIPEERGWSYYCDLYIEGASGGRLLSHICMILIEKAMPEEAEKEVREEIFNIVEDLIAEPCFEKAAETEEKLSEPVMTRKEALELLRKNTRYRGLIEQAEKQAEIDRVIKESILDHIPENLVELYPAARTLHRKFILHIGPTNSGKTYSAIEQMLKAPNGIYLGPLRLLAYEQYEKITGRGIACDLVTGEEEIITGGDFQASTIDVLNLHKHYASAVIDEAQMITDEFRGGRWTSAILGILADEVHICAAPEVEKILLKIISECGDEAEVIRHERMCELKADPERFSFPDGVKRGDALIVFSRRAVHSLAAELQRKDIRCSVIYGALPYDVRHEEARRFTEGETEVLVATDAIGMGLNLPIRRVVLMEQRKFDGKQQRFLKDTEIKQIAGRAGRAGIFDTGWYSALVDNSNTWEMIKRITDGKLPSIENIRIAFPEELLSIDGKVSELFCQWEGIKMPDICIKVSSEREISLAKELEKVSGDKKTIYELITVPFDERRPPLYNYWLGFAADLLKGETPEIYVNGFDGEITNGMEMRTAEDEYAMLDLQYQLSRKFGNEETKRSIMKEKASISGKICDFLARQTLEGKTCSQCGRILIWDSRHELCERCYKKKKRGKPG
ncbi:MAG: helicase [Lachnospiraceae bacterium]|nr:helicase [Lachnospiraceae bacterium]